MQNANYTSENICRAMGMDGFANDWQMARSEQTIRLLCKPSFTPELCLTFTLRADQARINLIAATSQIWQQQWETPKPVATLYSEGEISMAEFLHLTELLIIAECDIATPSGYTIIDGTITHTVMRGSGCGLVDMGNSRHCHPSYDAFIRQALQLAQVKLNDVNACIVFRNLYGLPKQHCRTLVLGKDEQSAQLMQALKKFHPK